MTLNSIARHAGKLSFYGLHQTTVITSKAAPQSSRPNLELRPSVCLPLFADHSRSNSICFQSLTRRASCRTQHHRHHQRQQAWSQRRRALHLHGLGVTAQLGGRLRRRVCWASPAAGMLTVTGAELGAQVEAQQRNHGLLEPFSRLAFSR